jgi:small-conductance mechanosensitive channel
LIGLFWIFYKIPYFKSLGSALFAGAGIFTAVIAFASQKAFSDIIGGIFILIFKPFRVNDIIDVAGHKGKVEEITLRHTIIKDYEFRRIVIPNSIISNDTIINSSITEEKIRKRIEFGISYDSDVDLAKKIIVETILKHPKCLDNRSSQEINSNDPIVRINMTSWGDSSVVLRAYVWASNNDVAFDMSFDILEAVKKEFEKNNIEIPYPHRTLVYKNNVPQTN